MENYLEQLKELFSQHANEDLASPMRAYMRDKFDYYGIKQPLRKTLTKQFIKEYGYPNVDEVSELLQLIWDEPYRELYYVGIDILERFIKKMPEDAIDLYEFLISNQSWWDTVDLIANKCVGGHLKRFPHLIPEVNEYFLKHDDMWLNRTALLFQLKYKSSTDISILTQNILYLAHSKEFFIQKAIGWVLREYSKTNAEFVKDFVANHDLAALSKKEALKWINKHNN